MGMESIDEYLGRRLRNWASSYKTPANGKARLLSAAALTPSHPPRETKQKFSHFDPYFLHFFKLNTHFTWHRDFSTRFFDWTIVYSFETSLVNLRLMY
jgi:hypothetical protein